VLYARTRALKPAQVSRVVSTTPNIKNGRIVPLKYDIKQNSIPGLAQMSLSDKS